MSTHAVRVWLPDRPGALGAVASRVGAVGGDVVGIDIIERGAGRAIDELVVDLPDPALVELMVAEIGEVDDVDVEDVRALDGRQQDPAVAALELARALRRCGDDAELSTTATAGVQRLLGADWAAVVEPTATRLVASSGEDVPSEPWLCAFCQGAVTGGVGVDLGDVAIATARGGAICLVVGRGHLPLRGREQLVLEAVAALL